MSARTLLQVARRCSNARLLLALPIGLAIGAFTLDQQAAAAGGKTAKDSAKAALVQARTLLLASDDFVDAGMLSSGTGRHLWTEATLALRARGIDVVAGSARSLARAGEEARDGGCTVIAAPQITRLAGSKRELTVAVEIRWYDLQRAELTHCTQSSRVTAPKGAEADLGLAIRQALDACLTEVLGPSANPAAGGAGGASLSPAAVIGATAALVYGKLPEDDPDPGLSRFQPRAGTPRELADALSAGRAAFIDRVYSRGDALIERLEIYHQAFGAAAAEVAVDVSTVKPGFRIRERLADRAALALLAALRASGVTVPDAGWLTIPATDPLDTVIHEVAVTLPRLTDAPPATANTATTWWRLTIDETGKVGDAQPMADSAPGLVEAIRALKFKPGTRAGQPVTTRMIFAYQQAASERKDAGPS